MYIIPTAVVILLMLGVLMEQTEYVSHCIKAILALYKGKMDNVVLIGHSMVRNIDMCYKE